MKIRNFEIEGYLNVLNDQNSFRFDTSVKQPPKVRFAIRKNIEALTSSYKSYEETRKEILEDAQKNGYVTLDEENNRYTIDPDHIQEINKELLELANIENDVELQLVEEAEMDEFLQNVSLSSPEEEVLLRFVKE